MVFPSARTSGAFGALTVYRDNWAKTASPNKNVKIYLGAPAGPLATRSGYVNADTLARDALKLRELYSSFGGVMLWDASQAYGMSFPLPFSRAPAEVHLIYA